MDSLTLILILPLVGALILFLSSKNYATLSIIHVIVSGITSLALLFNVYKVLVSGTFFSYDKFLFLDSLGAVFLVLIAITGFLVNLYSTIYMRWEFEEKHINLVDLRRYYGLCHVFIFTMTLSVICNNIAFMWAAIEATTLASVFLVAIHKDKKSTESGYKYIVLCSIGLAFALYATVLLYSVTFTTTQNSDTAMLWTTIMSSAKGLNENAMKLIFVFALIGFGTKAGLAPTHTWLPDVHAQGPAPISALLSGVLLKCAMLAILRYYAVTASATSFEFVQSIMLISGTITLFVAGIFLIRQHDVKRMFAYHSVVHMGVIAFALGIGGELGVFAAIFHCLAHSFTKALAFCSTGNIARIYGTKDMTKMGGMIKIAPVTTIMFAAAVCSLVGVPAFAIFVSEFLVFKGAIVTGQYFAVALFAIALAIIFIADFSHFNMASFGEPKGEVLHNKEMKFIENLPLILLCVLIIVFGVWHVDSFFTLVENGVKIIMGV
ncbi:hydrogenase 4 subunit F [Campylobacter geochelonis]|uniref:Hydrogenase-4 component F n=1 Tax=Campylobacter geochelonis TaxID=1780362 RepID=A0A128EHX1_9BACT|nr:hydrogenase 4 subunit F [Campylobacter geochelonis]QKF71930.1 hydrogenase-4, antiporter-like subunit [Campylobacter geochelonis]CZE47853.1 hydrogenase-4 component F [Campylobacter geochelonis]